MATWDEPIDSQTDPDAPVTSNLAKRWDYNVVALSEGAVGAPKVKSEALDLFFATTTGNYTGLGRIAKIAAIGSIKSTGVGGLVQYRLSSDGGVTWGPYVVLVSVVGGGSDNPTNIVIIDVAPAFNAVNFNVSGDGVLLAMGVAGVTP